MQKQKSTDPTSQLVPRRILETLDLIAKSSEGNFKSKRIKVISADEVREILDA